MPRKYSYRGAPCTNATHSVCGLDSVGRSGGVLEWCFSMEDAIAIYDTMLASGEFIGLKIYSEGIDK